MNYLAHAYLSFNRPGLLAGNMISDFIKGKKQFLYPADIQKGIRLHRSIDAFTDAHEIVGEAKLFFKKDYGLYSSPIVDVIFDHFLASDKQLFSEPSLAGFAQQVYHQLDPFQAIFPPPFQSMFPYMKRQDWLYNYRNKEGIARSLEGLTRRARYMQDSSRAYQLFLEHYEALRNCYSEFFPHLQEHAQTTMLQLLSNDERTA